MTDLQVQSSGVYFLPVLPKRGTDHASWTVGACVHAWPICMICLSAILSFVFVLTLGWLSWAALQMLFF
jgi:hypothetical protein